MPAVSVIMPTYNNASELPLATRSVLEQTLGDLELILVNDGSTDDTGRVCEQICAADSRVVALHNPANRGRARARNRAIEHARADLIAILDADDVAMPDRLARQAAFLAAHPAVGLLGCWSIRITQASRPVELLSGPTTGAAIRRRLRQLRMPFLHSSAVFRRDVLARTGLYDPALIRSQDADLFRRVIQQTQAAALPAYLVLYRMEGELSDRSIRARYHWSARAGWEALKRRPDPLGFLHLGRLLLMSALPTGWVKSFSGLYRARPAPEGELLRDTQAWIDHLTA
ncbi:MAG TPA: glycosyltransferase family 2 protein [Anaerolineaceae bacterium]|nr:glycosyltransferase family 2 protein [Anaerolineaceae bacterium]